MEKTQSKKNPLKNPLLISVIVSCVIIIVSLFILGFFGMRLSTSLAGGSQFEVTLSKDADTKQYVRVIKDVLSDNGLYLDSSFVEDNFKAKDENAEFTQRCLVINIGSTNISDEVKQKVKEQVIASLNLSESDVTDIEVTTPAVKAKDVLFLGLAIGIVAIALFVFAWIRHNIFAGLSFIIAFLHNIILYLAILILTRVEVSLMSLSIALVLTVIMSIVMINIYEKFREVTKLKLEEKIPVLERMKSSELSVIKPYIAVAATVLVISIILLFAPVASVKLSALSMIFALIVSAYSSLIIGPGTYASLLEVKDLSLKAKLSRNDTVNKEIKKKIRKNSKDSSLNVQESK